MRKNQATDHITDREMIFARLTQSGIMTDRQAAEAVGLDPDTASSIKSKPCVQTYMLELSAVMQQQLIQQEAEGLHRQTISREQVLIRLWEIARMSPDITRNSVTGQVKSLSMIVAIEGLVPDRKEKPSDQPSPKANIFRAPWLPKRPGEDTDDQPSPDPVPHQPVPHQPAPHQKVPAIPDPSLAAAADTLSDPEPTPSQAPSPSFDSSEFNPAQSLTPARTNHWVPEASGFAYVPDQKVALPKNRFGRQNRYGRGR
jgi:hypothetical protein